MLVILDRPAVVFVLWLIVIPLWACFMYAIFKHALRMAGLMNSAAPVRGSAQGSQTTIVEAP